MDQIVLDVIRQAVAPVVTAVMGVLIGRVTEARKKAELREREALAEAEERTQASERRIEAIADGVRSLLRCELVRSHAAHCIRGEPMSLSDREYVARTYEAYHELGGNGTGTALYEAMMRVEIREDS